MKSPTPSIGAAVDRLELLLADSDSPIGALTTLGDRRRLDLLLNILLGTLLRRGPGKAAGALTVGGLIDKAARAAAEGLVPVATPLGLQKTLVSLAESLRRADAWHRDAPLWWAPLPPRSTLEELAHDLEKADTRLVDVESCATSLAERSYATLPGLLKAARCRKLHEQLETAWVEGNLTLEPGAVGASGRVTTLRSDLVLYLSGLEREVLSRTPALATLVQWGLEHLEGYLRKAYPGGPVFAPQKAMLTRYPAPSGGYEVHIDNPGGDDDNGRQLTLVLYLNAPEQACIGGELALWQAQSTDGPTAQGEPVATVPATGGNAVVFESRKIPHQVRPLKAGPARWALTFWCSDSPQGPPLTVPPPLPSLTELLLPLEDPPLPPERLLFHEMALPEGILVHPIGTASVRPGIVATVYRGGPFLEAWCEHHLAMGFVHILLVFDHLDDTEEKALVDRLRARFPQEQLTIWPGQDLAAQGWPSLPNIPSLEELRQAARGGGSSIAHAARQALNACVALEQARDGAYGGSASGTDAFGSVPLDWLLHLDADELFYLQGRGRGGIDAQEHFSTAQAAGVHKIRYLNHELLLPHAAGAPARFKANPRLAAARLGAKGWRALVHYLEMDQAALRPYFRAYHNGKSAVAVRAAQAAAGVHGWHVSPAVLGREAVLAGPSILHLHLPSTLSFRRTYLAKAGEEVLDHPTPFAPSPLEAAALKCARASKGAPRSEVHAALDAVYRQRTFFREGHVEILAEAGLVLTPELAALDAWTSEQGNGREHS